MLFFIANDNRQVGPLNVSELADYGLTPDTKVWHEGMDEWLPASQVPELAAVLGIDSGDYAPAMKTEPKISPYAPPGYEPTEAELAEEQGAGSDESLTPPSLPEQAYMPPQSRPPIGQPMQNETQQIPQQSNGNSECPSSWLVPCLLATLLLCNVVGIVGVIFAARVKPYFECGDYDNALKASNNARNWLFIALGVGIVIALVIAVFAVFMYSMIGVAEANGAFEGTI